MDFLTKALLDKKVNGIISGVDSVSVTGTTLEFSFSDGTSANMEFPSPENGISITGIKIAADKHLMCTMSNGSVIDAGLVPTVSGKDGEPGKNGKTPEKGVDYFSDSDKQEIINSVLSSIPSAEGGRF